VAGSGFVLALVLVNVWNFMDGIDGLAGSQALVASAAYALFAGSGPVAWLGVALAAACAGFLPFNLPRARIFLGDVGSGTLGYLLATLVALSLPVAGRPAAPLLLLPLLVFGVDASLTLARRWLRGERWWEPHVQHAYQVQARRWGHGAVTAGYLGVSIAASVMMVTARNSPPMVIMCTTAAFAALACGAWWRLQRSAAAAGAPGRGIDR
jgi:UDP-N-acetylmuramyl pentapeptide phosphotransferase/UDP-N-acetylglucosamine-1-phosphate transferase